MKTLTINITRKNGEYVGILEECPEVSCTADRIDDIVHAMKVSIMNIKDNKPEVLNGGPLKFRLCGSEKTFFNLALERDTQSRNALNDRLAQLSQHLERISPLTLEDVALQIFCHYYPMVDGKVYPSDEERMEESFKLAEKFLLHKQNRYRYYWRRQFGLEEE